MTPAAPAVRDSPQAYIAGDRRRALAAGRALPDRCFGSALFADISGFTPLTEALIAEWGPERGAEELSVVLESVFDTVLWHLHRFDGSAVYFSGDAITCWLDGDDGMRAAACALAMQAAMTEVGTVHLPSGGSVVLAMKVAVAVGPARRFVVGDPSIQLIDVLAGPLMDRLAAAEQAAAPGEVLLDVSARQSLGDRVVGEVRRAGSLELMRLDRLLVRPLESPPAPVDRLPDELVRPWLLPAVWERMRTGRGEFLAELRPAVPLFLRFDVDGLRADEPEHDSATVAALDGFVVAAQRVVDGLGGSLLQLTIGDKGAYLYAVFGSPIAHEDDAARACAAALQLRELGQAHPVGEVQIGLSLGRLRSGTYGHTQRRTFCCLGDAVNVAARLMAGAPPGQIIATAEVRLAAGDSYGWEALGAHAVKGRSERIQTAALTGRHHGRRDRARGHSLAMVGRTEELAVLADHVDAALSGRGRVVTVSGAAGVGKSRLLHELDLLLDLREVTRCAGEASAFDVRTSYAPWDGVMTAALGLPSGPPAARADGARSALSALDPTLLPRLPLLGAVLDLGLPETDLTAALTPQLRKTSLEGLVASVLARIALDRPVAIVIEDAQWLDPLSVDLTRELARTISDLPVLVVIALRGEARDPLASLRELPTVADLALPELDRSACESLVADWSLQHAADLPAPDLLETVLDRAEGNPFYLTELLAYVRNQPTAADGEARLPDSLHSLVLSRIDTLPEGPRRTVKVGSVIGREFTSPTLRGVYPDLGSAAQVQDQLSMLQGSGLVLAESQPEPEPEVHRFRHLVTAQVAYEATPASLRSLLHERMGAFSEEEIRSRGTGFTAAQLDLLAYHYGRSADHAKTREYLHLAGDRARTDYANAAAIGHYRRLTPLLDGAEQAGVQLHLGAVLELTGEWGEAEQTYLAAAATAESVADMALLDRTRVALAEVARKQGRYADAGGLLDLARAGALHRGDRAGVAEVARLSGTLAAQQGDYETARTSYSAGLTIQQELGDRAATASLLSNLAVIAEYTGDLEQAQRLGEQGLALRVEVGDRWAIGVSQNNLGMIALLRSDPAAAIGRFTEAMRLNTEIGDSWMVAIAHNNLGNAHRLLGELGSAGTHLAAALSTYRRYDDRWALAVGLDDVAVLAARRADHDSALVLVGAADVVREELGSPRPPAQQQELDAHLVDARSELGAWADEATASGRTLTIDQAVDRALVACADTAETPPGRTP